MENLINNLNLVEVLLIPLLGYLGKAVKDLITAHIEKARQSAKEEALAGAMEYAQYVVQTCFVQIIEPAWKAFKENPGDKQLKDRYESALFEAKNRAMSQMGVHLNKLPAFIAEYLSGKVNDIIEGSIPLVKATNKTVKNP